VNKQRAAVPLWLRLRRVLIRGLARAFYLLLGRVSVEGLDNVPRGTAYAVALNHTSIYDSPLMLSFWPESIAAIGAADVFDKPVQGQILSWYGATPVHRGSVDRTLIDEMLLTLRSGTPLMIAPEGGRSHEPAMRRAKPGIALVVDETGVPVVPVGILGATDDFLARGLRRERPQIGMRIGKPFHLPKIEGRGEERRQSRQRNADLVMRRIAELLPPEYHGVYAGTVESAPSPEGLVPAMAKGDFEP
jgi:1-acyl-sn-glycerol-3-phosphate acyltransferase